MEHPGTQYSRPWGYYEVLLDEPGLKVKKIVVEPGRRLSLQRHRFRSEHWYIAEGAATVLLESNEFVMNAGASADIAEGAVHRLANPGERPLVIIEIQQGSYLEEDDIERFADDYGRASHSDSYDRGTGS